MEWVGEFFAALPDVARALWRFGAGWVGVAISVGSLALTAGFLLAARALRDTAGWLAAIFGGLAATIAGWWAFGILPSAWVYFADQERTLLENTIVPETLGVGRFVVATNFYQVFRDTIVVIESGIALVGFAVVALMIQKRYPRTLAEGEEARPQSGGYK